LVFHLSLNIQQNPCKIHALNQQNISTTIIHITPSCFYQNIIQHKFSEQEAWKVDGGSKINLA
jgi:hypothetical protein